MRADKKDAAAVDEMGSAPPREGSRYRALLGLVAIGAGVSGLVGLFFIEVPPGNRDALMLALGIVLGWGSTVVTYEFGSSPTGRKAAEAGISRARGSGAAAP